MTDLSKAEMDLMPDEQAQRLREEKQAALRHILDAWEIAAHEGIDPDCIASAAIFAALSDMISVYGEEPVARMAERLPERVRTGEFSTTRVLN